MDPIADKYWNYEAQPRNRIATGAVRFSPTAESDSSEGPQAQELVGFFNERDRFSLDDAVEAVVATTLIGGCQAIALRVYGHEGALCWLFAPTDPQAVQALERWCDSRRLKLVANFGSSSQTVEVELNASQAVAQMLRITPPVRDSQQVQRLCDKVAFAESDGLLNSLAFVPMTHAVEKRVRSTCLVETKLVSLAFECFA